MNFFNYKSHGFKRAKLWEMEEKITDLDLEGAEAPKNKEELEQAIQLRMERQKHSDFYNRL